MRIRAVRIVRRSLVWGVVALTLGWSVFPFWWAITYSLKRPANLFDGTVVPFLQFPPTLEHWRWEWEGAFGPDGMGWTLLTGTGVALGVAFVCVALGATAAVGLLRLRRSGGPVSAVLGLVLLPRLLPPVVVALPLFLIDRSLGLADTRLGLVVAQSTLALPLAVVVLQEAVRELPADLLDAAQLDGASWWGMLRAIVAPLLAPALVAVGLLCFATSWNEYLYALLNHGQRVLTPPVAVALLEDRDGIPFEHVGTHLSLIMLPPLVLTMLAQRYVVRGLTLGALRG